MTDYEFHFFCTDCKSELESNITRHKEAISVLQSKNNELNIDVHICLKNLIEIKEEKQSELNRCTAQRGYLTSDQMDCYSDSVKTK